MTLNVITILLVLFNLCFYTHSHGSKLETWLHKSLDDIQYIFVIDGGGSKTELQVLDSHGEVVQLNDHEQITDITKAGSSNFNTVGDQGIQDAAQKLLCGVTMTPSNHTLSSVASQSLLIGGFAGADRPEAHASLLSTFKKYGFDEKNIFITTDAELTLEIADTPGIILIAGTGSICFGKKDEKVFRVGGLGRHIGDEGSGYKIGLAAFKASLEEEFGWGTHTSLTQELKAHFAQTNIKSLITPFYQNAITPDQIASLVPIVFSQAAQGDVLALKIIDDAAQNLGWLLKTMVATNNFPKCSIHVVGGVFKNTDIENFIQKMLTYAELPEWNVVNQSHDRIATAATQKLLKNVRI